ncbi:MAG: CAAX prenyl protease-related protein [Chthoniobacterales bacterium]|nr:CAAX prenyl protease-related protein [Chthoniobacterales bacterium]
MTTGEQTTCTERRAFVAYIAPFAVFMAGLALVSAVGSFAPEEGGPLWLSDPKYWVYPLQTIACGALLLWFWKAYEWGDKWHVIAGIAAGLLVLALWISPQWLLGAAPRNDGFNPDLFAESSALWWTTVGMRFLRLVVVVPLLEEIFWRGFLLRYLIKEDFTKVPFGTFSWFSFGIVTVMFGLAHWGPDFVPALLTGAIYNLLAVKTRSLACCVIAHAVTNLGLGIYIMQTKQWGFW